MNGKIRHVYYVVDFFAIKYKEDFLFQQKQIKKGVIIMVRFNYKDVAKEQGWCFNSINPTVEDESGYFYYKEVANVITPKTIMLDIGCGSGEKAIRYYSNAEKVIMVDNESEMLKRANKNIEIMLDKKEKLKFETRLCDGNKKLKFPDEYFDLVVSRHCGANMTEVFRVLKKGGVFISEDIDYKDCLELKKYFGRGQNWDEIQNEKPLKKEVFEKCIDLEFTNISLKSFYFIEYYPDKEQLKYLLTRTPILEYFGRYDDEKILDKYVNDFKTNKGIKLVRRLYAFYLIK